MRSSRYPCRTRPPPKPNLRPSRRPEQCVRRCGSVESFRHLLKRRPAMSRFRSLQFTLLAILTSLALQAQVNPASTNNLPNPYRPVEGWGKLPAGVEWKQVIATDFDSHG